ncbi:G-box-binding factor 1 [Spatholobus suberectus]|nr:G-box-binding factor 1 [Spatholobus suberectus]
MESQKNKEVAKPDQISVHQDETQKLQKPLPLPWSTSTQIWNRPFQYGSLYGGSMLSNYPMAAGSALLASAEKNMNSMNIFNKSLQPITKESRENGKRPSIPETIWEKLTRSAASESMETTVVGHDVNNAGGSTKFSPKLQDFPSTKKQQSSMMPSNGGGEHNVNSIENCKAVHVNRNVASDHFEANPTERNQNLGTDTNASGTNPQLEREEADETEEQRKREAKKKSSKRSRMKIALQDFSSIKKQQSSTMPGNGGGEHNVTSFETCNAVHENTNIASDHFEANPTELNQNLSTDPNASGTNPQFEGEESDESEEQRKRRRAKKKSSKRSKMKIEKERAKLIDSVDNLDAENAALKKQLLDLSDECVKLTEENNSLMEELVEKYGLETIVNLMNAKPTDSVAGGGQS